MNPGIRSVAAAALTVTLAGCDLPNQLSGSQDSHPVSMTASEITARPERLFLQQISSNSAIIKWRGAASEACIAENADTLSAQPSCVAAQTTEANHR